MSSIIQFTKSWPGFSGVKNLIIFGDSYSSVLPDRRLPKPNASQPLGIDWPGFTWNEDGLPNWVGHLITKYAPEPRFDSASKQQDDAYVNSPLLVYDYALGGDTIVGIQAQVERGFMSHMVNQNVSPWSGQDILFVIWFGINDCACSDDPTRSLNILNDLLEQLFSAGARNFLFIDVPPIQKSPALLGDCAYDGRYENWNTALSSAIRAFVSRHLSITVLLFSSHAVFSAVVGEPEKYGFNIREVSMPFGRVWNDLLHPTSKIHDILADAISIFLHDVARP